MALPVSKKAATEFTPLEAGTYQMTLRRIDLDIFKEFETEAFNNGDGLRYQGCTFIWDADGDEYRERFVKVSLNERAKFYNRLTAVLGRDITEDEALEWTLGASIRTDAEYDDCFKPNDDIYESADGNERGTYKLDEAKTNESGAPIVKFPKGVWQFRKHEHDGVVGGLDDLKIGGESVYGKSCLLVVKVNAKGYNNSAAGAASPLPKANRRAQPIPAGMPT